MIWFWSGPWWQIVWTIVWFRSDQRSFPSGKVSSEKTWIAIGVHTVFQTHFSLIKDTLVWDGLIKGYFRLERSDPTLSDGISTWGNWEGYILSLSLYTPPHFCIAPLPPPPPPLTVNIQYMGLRWERLRVFSIGAPRAWKLQRFDNSCSSAFELDNHTTMFSLDQFCCNTMHSLSVSHLSYAYPSRDGMEKKMVIF